MSRSVSLALMLAGLPALAQEHLPTVADVLAGVRDTEVYVLGAVTTDAAGGLVLRLPDGTLVPADSGSGIAETVVSAGCMGGMLCGVTGYGELQWDGPTLRLLIDSIETLGPPAELN